MKMANQQSISNLVYTAEMTLSLMDPKNYGTRSVAFGLNKTALALIVQQFDIVGVPGYTNVTIYPDPKSTAAITTRYFTGDPVSDVFADSIAADARWLSTQVNPGPFVATNPSQHFRVNAVTIDVVPSSAVTSIIGTIQPTVLYDE